MTTPGGAIGLLREAAPVGDLAHRMNSLNRNPVAGLLAPVTFAAAGRGGNDPWVPGTRGGRVLSGPAVGQVTLAKACTLPPCLARAPPRARRHTTPHSRSESASVFARRGAVPGSPS